MSTSKLFGLGRQIFEIGLPQILLRALPGCLHLSRKVYNACGFQKLVQQIVCVRGSFLQASFVAYPCSLYRLYFPCLSQGKDALDLHKIGYRNGAVHPSYPGYSQMSIRMTHGAPDVIFSPYFPSMHDHSRLDYCPTSIPNIASHCKKMWSALCQLSPKIYQCTFAQNPFQSPIEIAHSSRGSATSRRVSQIIWRLFPAAFDRQIIA